MSRAHEYDTLALSKNSMDSERDTEKELIEDFQYGRVGWLIQQIPILNC